MFYKSMYFRKLLASFSIVVAIPLMLLCSMLYRTGVGYWNISSFARRFKQEEGMTANQWREVERNNSTSK